MRSIRRLNESDAEQYAALRREALSESPMSFGASPETDFSSSLAGTLEQIRGTTGASVVGAFEDDRLIGSGGLLHSRHAKARHKITLWGLYVLPGFRGSGVGRELIDALLREAKADSEVCRVQLSVSAAAPAARHLYERAGFTVWGIEEDALRVAGESVVDYHMALRVR